jgi:Mg-chelatase subunit ChlD
MRHDLTDITIILDRSGSMQTVRTDTIGGYNAFIAAQAALPGEARISLVQFDHEYAVVYAGVECAQVAPLTTDTFSPRGNTALLDAIGRTIHDTGNRFNALHEDERPGKVVVVIITDGEENASSKFTREQVLALITQQRERYQWEFVFLGANQDAIIAGAALGVPARSSLSYAADAQGTSDVFGSAAGYVGNLRSVGKASFSAADRDKQQRS